MNDIEEFKQGVRDRIKSTQERDLSSDVLGSGSGQVEADLEQKASQENFASMAVRGFNSVNAIGGTLSWLNRQGIQADPSFDLKDHQDELFKDLPSDYWNSFATTSSLQEALTLKADIKQEVQDKQMLGLAGAKGVAASVLSGIIDVDAPLMFLSGGSYLAPKIGKTLVKAGEASRLGSAVQMGVAGAEAGLISEAVNVMTRPTGEWTDVPYAAMSGLVLGSSIGAIAGPSGIKAMKSEKGFMAGFADKPDNSVNEALSNLKKDFDESVQNKEAGRIDYTSSIGADDVFDFGEVIDPTAVSVNSAKLIEKSSKFVADNKIMEQIDTAFPDNAIGNAAKKFYKVLDKSPVKSDWDALMNSQSDIAKTLAFKMFESPAGIVRNNKSSAVLNNIYSNQISSPVNTSYPTNYVAWATRKHGKPDLAVRHNQKMLDEFNKEVMIELQTRYHDGMSSPNVDPYVKTMADNIDIASANAVNILKGRSGEASVKGSENLQAETGWFRQMWDGKKLVGMINELDKQFGKKKGRKLIEETLANSYVKIHNWDFESALKYSKAVTRRGVALNRGIDTNVARLLDQEGQEFLFEFMQDNGFSRQKAQEMIDGLKGIKSEKNKESILKHRKDIDLREQIPGTSYRLLDIVNSDIPSVWTGYARRASGAASMARHGIQKANKKEIIDAVLSEQSLKGSSALNREQLESMFSYFDGGAFAGGVDPWVRRALQTTNLALLNSLGLTQMAEVGVQVASVGFDAFRRSAPKEVKELLSGKNSELMEELRPWTAAIDGEHNIFMDHLMLDESRPNTGMYAETGQFLDRMLSTGQRAQGYLSGFYKVKQLQQRTAVRSVIYRLADMFTKDKAIGDARLYDMGFGDKALQERVGNYFKNGTVQFTANGDVLKLNFDKWDYADVLDFASVLNRHTDQVVQTALRGESTVWMHKSVGALLTHLKSFTITAMQKQLIRNARIMDTEAAMAFLYGLGTAGVVYTAQQALKGNEQNLTASKIAKGSFMLNNMTGWIPQWSDPLMSMLGMDNLRFNHYGAQGVGGDVIGIPPVIPTMNRVAHIPEASIGLLSGNYKNEDIYALQATPIVGNLYGFSYMFNKMKEDLKNKPTEE